jgi:steroid Delta-isomerase
MVGVVAVVVAAAAVVGTAHGGADSRTANAQVIGHYAQVGVAYESVWEPAASTVGVAIQPKNPATSAAGVPELRASPRHIQGGFRQVRETGRRVSREEELLNERSRKQLAFEHCRLMNAGDVDGLLGLYADEVVFEDPVGGDRQRGRDALRTHFTQAVAAHIHEAPGEPVAGQDDVHVLIPVTAIMDYLPKGPDFVQRGWLNAPNDATGKRLKRDYMLMLRTGDDGRIEELKVFWGRSDLEVIS